MKKKILAIDDSKAIRFLLQTVLSNDFEVITAPDGCSAMYWLSKRNMPDMIILDAQLPDMQNWELVEQLSSSGLYSEIPLVVLSSLDKIETEAKSKEYRVVKTFNKPFNPVLLLDSISQFFSTKKTASVATETNY